MPEITYDDSYLTQLEATDTPDSAEAFDPDAEYNRPAPPIHDGWYYVTLKNNGVFVEGTVRPYRQSQWKNESKPYHEISVMGIIHKPEDPLVDGKIVRTDMPLRTKPDPDRNNASGVSAAYRAITGEPIPGLPGLNHVKLLDEALRSEPQCWVRVQNKLQDDDAAKAARESGGKSPKAVYGEKKIMALKGGTDSQGKFTGAADHPETGKRCVARAYIVEIKPKDFTPPAAK